ncbi:MAG TPA: threonine synthase [bacterium]|nr:threonine synthase [bacterium]
MKSILFYSTNQQSPPVPFREALLQGQAPDRGLYMPESIPVIDSEEIAGFSSMDYPEIAFHVSRRFLWDQIEEEALKRLVYDAYDYPVPLEELETDKVIMRLDQGPTASFKDFAARMMGRLMQYYLDRENRELLILTATSGDTGSAIANAFYGLGNIRVVVLFPKDEVTARQRKQMTTLGQNVCILALDAKFDDCQALVKKAFADPDLAGLNLSSANSINIGRLLPQSIYYFYAWARLRRNRILPIVFSVPSGNFGDMMGGLLAFRMGLPVKRFVISTNENDEFPLFLKNGRYEKIVPSRNCLSSAMNVGHPSNLARVVALYNGQMDEQGRIFQKPDMEAMRRDMASYSITDRETEKTIQHVYRQYRTLLEPHGAAGWAGLQRFLNDHPESAEDLCVSLETAHPAKFPEKLRELLSVDPDLPPSLEGLESKNEDYEHLPNTYEAFKHFLTDRYAKG